MTFHQALAFGLIGGTIGFLPLAGRSITLGRSHRGLVPACVLALLAGLGACAPVPPQEPRISLAGLTEAEAVQRLGPPDAVEAGPPRVLTWTNVDATRVGWRPGDIAAFRCTVTAFIEQGRVAAFRRHGNGC